MENENFICDGISNVGSVETGNVTSANEVTKVGSLETENIASSDGGNAKKIR